MKQTSDNEKSWGRKMRGRLMVTAFLALLICVSFGLTRWVTTDRKMQEVARSEPIPSVNCARIVNGTTVWVTYADRSRMVRLVGIIAPSAVADDDVDPVALTWAVSPRRIREQRGTAEKILTTWVKRRRVEVVPSEDAVQRDEGGPLSAYIKVYGVDVGKKLLQSGLVIASDEKHPLEEDYRRFQVEARTAKKGLWRP